MKLSAIGDTTKKAQALTFKPGKKTKKDKNKKVLKRINKILNLVDRQFTKLNQITQKLQAIKASYEKKAA